MELAENTQVVISLWTLVACWFFLWRLSSSITKFQKEVEMELKDHEERLKDFEKMDLKKILTEIQINIQRIMKKMEEK